MWWTDKCSQLSCKSIEFYIYLRIFDLMMELDEIMSNSCCFKWTWPASISSVAPTRGKDGEAVIHLRTIIQTYRWRCVHRNVFIHLKFLLSLITPPKWSPSHFMSPGTWIIRCSAGSHEAAEPFSWLKKVRKVGTVAGFYPVALSCCSAPASSSSVPLTRSSGEQES